MIRTKLRPAKRLLQLVCALVLLLPILIFTETASLLTTVLIAGLLVLALLDYLPTRFKHKLSIEINTNQNMSLGRWQPVKLSIKNTSEQLLITDISLHLSNAIELSELYTSVTLAENEQARLQWSMCAHQRGDAQLAAVELRISSRLKLWQANWIIPQDLALKVYPDFSRVAQNQALNGVTNTPISGLKLTKKRGDGIEFHQLREYRQGDSIKQIDWQATSKRRKLISKEYQEEQNQHVVVMLDASKKMNIDTIAGTHFDHALNALLLLAHTVLKQGDWFSMQSFNHDIRWLPNVKGAQNVSRVMNHFYDLYPDQSSSDYLVAANQLIAKRSKRSLVLLVTTFDDQSLEEVLPAIKLLQKHHLVAVINLSNHALTEVLAEPIENYDYAMTYCAALDLLNTHKANMARLKKEGVIAIDTQPQKLLPNVLNTYLNVKHSGVL
ncbi:DUF58 domain-containing protein [Pseudoalteromonas rhizosphaerae]|uniref:DUF58 domain-containing protein n=1 Tax=Pseudoalteromonas rhizosphaerae TaxID=2518973 RepID=UPI00123096E0|nr:DUF58 domain-containing protein [Pseudoalteromonas rhizosphaerae]